MKYTVYLTTTASLSMTVEVPDDADEYEAREAAIVAAFENAPGGVCASCSGYGADYRLDLGDWDIEQGPDGNEVQPEPKS